MVAVIGYSMSGAGEPVIFSTILFNLYLLTLGIGTIVVGLRNERLGTVNVGMLILMTLILARFFDSDMGFVARGIAFIILGIGFLTTNLVLMRRGGVK